MLHGLYFASMLGHLEDVKHLTKTGGEELVCHVTEG